MLTRINDIHKLQQVVQYFAAKRSKPVSITPVIRENGITLEYRVDGELVAEERKLTAAMAEKLWHNRYKSDHVWVSTAAFQQFARDIAWAAQTTIECWSQYRKHNFVMAEVRDERAIS